MRQLYFIEGQFFGESPRQWQVLGWGTVSPQSMLFYCGCCGEVYAKCPVVHKDGRQATWTSCYGCCRKCFIPGSMTVPGSIWHYSTAFTDAFPLSILQRELNLHLAREL